MSIGLSTKGIIAQLNTQVQDCAVVKVGAPAGDIVVTITDNIRVIVGDDG